jgi:hypothetical protein
LALSKSAWSFLRDDYFDAVDMGANMSLSVNQTGDINVNLAAKRNAISYPLLFQGVTIWVKLWLRGGAHTIAERRRFERLDNVCVRKVVGLARLLCCEYRCAYLEYGRGSWRFSQQVHCGRATNGRDHQRQEQSFQHLCFELNLFGRLSFVSINFCDI